MHRRLRFERLEDRALLAIDTWIGGSGYWGLASNWSGGVPTSATDAVINTATAATITISAGQTFPVNSLTVGANNTLSLPGGGDPSNPTSNLISTNSGFESPVVANSTTHPATWGAWGSSYLSTQYAFSGTQSLAVSGADSGVTQQFTVTPGASYTASVYAMTPAGNPLTGNINAELQLLFFTSTGTQISSYSAPNQVLLLSGSSGAGGPLTGSVGNQGWNHFSTTAVAPSNAASAKVQVVTFSDGGTFGGAVYYDAIKFGPSATGPSTLVATTSLTNQGTITIGPTNSITVNGAYSQASTGTLDIQLGGPPTTNFAGSLTITGGANLAGTLKAELLYGYTPATTDTFTPVTFASETGSFSNYSGPTGTGYQLAATTSFTNIMLSGAPTAAVTSTISAASPLHAVSDNMLGVNMVWWDTADVNSQTQQMSAAAGFKLFRFPGGSSSDEYHFNVSANGGDSSAITVPQFAQYIASADGTGLVTLDYGSGSPQEAAAELAYLEGSATDTTVIGNGIEWNTTTNQWQTVNWGTAGYWAALRGAKPLATDDGLNFLRINHAAPFTAIKYWEVGNEEYGNWETDHHGTAGPGGVSTGAQHDAATYAAFARQFSTLAASILAAAGLPGISIGIDSGDPTGGDNFWTKDVLTAGASIGFVPGFISDHSYMQDPGNESDSFLLNNSAAFGPSMLDWSTRYAAYQTLLQQTLGSQASGVQLLATEFNSVSFNPGKQSTSLVNGLFMANSLGSLLDSGYVGGTAWDLRNGWDTTQNDSNQLYGWREGGDYGMLGTSAASAPASGTYIAYPNYFAEQLVSKIAGPGGQVVPATSSYGDLDVYAVMQANGDLGLLVVNTNPAATITDQFSVTGFQPAGSAQIWQYGKAQDTAQSLSSTGASALASSSTTLSVVGSSFSYSFPAYSMTVLDLKPQTTTQVLTSIAVSLVSSNLSTTGTEQFSATARDQFGNPMTTPPAFTWSVVGSGSINTSGLFTPAYVSGGATIKATSGSVSGSTGVSLPGIANWIATTAGSWNASANWQSWSFGGNVAAPGGRGVGGDTVIFQSATGATANLNGANPALASITFNNSGQGYTIAQGTGGTLQIGAGTSTGTIEVAAGNDSITAPLALLSNLSIDTAANSSLTIGGAISGAGKSLTKTGSGTLTLSGANSLGGGINVSGGSLIVKSGASIGGSLVIGGGATVTIAATNANGIPLDGGESSTPTSTGISASSAISAQASSGAVAVGTAAVPQASLGAADVGGMVDAVISTPPAVASGESDNTINKQARSAVSSLSVSSNSVETAPPSREFWAGSLESAPADSNLPPSAQATAILDALLAQSGWKA